MFRSSLLVVFVLLAGLSAVASPAGAATFSASVPNVSTVTAPTPVSALDACFAVGFCNSCFDADCCSSHPNNAIGGASSAADRGILKAKSSAHILCGIPSPWPSTTENAESGFLVDDVVIGGPASPATVPATLHLVLDGNITGSSQVLVEIFWGNPGQHAFGVMGPTLGNPGWGATGILAGQTGPGLVSLAIDVDLGLMPVNTAFSIQTDIIALVGTLTPALGSANSNFFDDGGLHFPGPGPFKAAPSRDHSTGAAAVFTLPPGYTANIPSLNVANNSWTGGTVSVQTSAWGTVKSLYR